MPALANFLRDELPRRGWTVPEWAPRAKLSVSNGYLIVRDGKDNVRQDTFNNIAASFGMTPAELKVAIGEGSEELTPIQRSVLRDLAFMLEINDSIEGIPTEGMARAYLESALNREDYRRYVDMVLKARASQAKTQRSRNTRRRTHPDTQPVETDKAAFSEDGPQIPTCQQGANETLTSLVFRRVLVS